MNGTESAELEGGDLPGVVANMPKSVGAITLVVGALLLALPRCAGRLLALPDGEQETAIRLVGLSDLALVPGLLAGRPRWPWMLARSALNLMDAAYLEGIAAQGKSPGRLRSGAKAMLLLTAIDGISGLILKRAGR